MPMEEKNIPPIDDNSNLDGKETSITDESVTDTPEPQDAAEQGSTSKVRKDEGDAAPTIKGEHKQRRLFKRTRGGIELTREEVKEIKEGRKKLRKQLRERGIKSRKEFEMVASGLGLYFDKRKWFPLLLWFLHGRALWALLGALAALMLALFGFSVISQLRGHFTINMSESMFREGFTLSETIGFENPTMRLFAQAAENVPCVSIVDIKDDVDTIDGQHNEVNYFAYTFYIRNEGENTVSYDWTCHLNSESHNLSDAAWVMIFEDGEMNFYAEAREDGTQEALPYFDDNSRGYLTCPLLEQAASPEEQFQLIKSAGGVNYYRMVPHNFLTDTTIAGGTVTEVEPMEVHKYTVVIWLEGDDPDCTDDLIGGHAGMDMEFSLIDDEKDSENKDGDSFSAKWDAFWDNLKFWEG